MNHAKDIETNMNKRVDKEKKVISISSKRQMTIPRKFFEQLGFSHDAECFLRGDELVVRPLKVMDGDLSAEILSDLIKQGYSGDDLLNRFKLMQKKVRPAIEMILDEAEMAAEGMGEYYSIEDVFDQED